MADIRQQAVATAHEYQQGNIATLDDATTRRLIASTVMTQSHGGDPAMTDHLGFVGRYKAGAAFLAEAGYVDKAALSEAMSGHKSEWAWAKSGAMAAFLEDGSHWKQGLSLDAYRQSPALQDMAFKRNAEAHHERALEQGFLGEDDKPGRVAGFLKAAHVVGFNSAREAMIGGRAYRDSQGISNYDRIHDISRNGDGLDALMPTARRPAVEAQAAAAHVSTPDQPASVARPDHSEHGQFRQIYAGLVSVGGLANDQERQQAAASIMVATRAAELQRVDHVVAGPAGTVFAVQGDLRDPSHRMVALNLSQLASQSIETSTAQLAALAPQTASVADAPRQEHPRLA